MRRITKLRNTTKKHSTKFPTDIKCLRCDKIVNLSPKSSQILFNNTQNKTKDQSENLNSNQMTIPTINNSNPSNNSTNINIFCNICHTNEAEFECLNCDLILCFDCKNQHIIDPQNQAHKINSYELNPKITTCQCPIHKLNYEYFCMNDNTPLCPKCYEILHSEHKVKLITEINDYYIKNIENEINKGEINLVNLEKCISDMMNLKVQYEKEKHQIFKQLDKNFQDIHKIILTQKNFMHNQINSFFEDKVNILNKKILILNKIKQRFEYFKKYLSDNKIFFIDKVTDKLNKHQLYKNLKYLNNSVFTKINYDNINKKIQSNSYLTNSQFINDPYKKISYSIQKYSFLPLQLNILNHLKKIFQKSNIIKPEMIKIDLLLVLPKITFCKLLYRVSELGPSAELFHKFCDNKGPTLILVKTATGHIFGGFNSIGFKNISDYELSYENFLFSLSDGQFRKPMRCPIVKQLAEYAIKQSTVEYSPGFGISNEHDLFIAFKKLHNSYSKLGKVYKCPKGFNAKSFLAGKENFWDITDVEVYQIKYIPDEEFYLLCY